MPRLTDEKITEVVLLTRKCAMWEDALDTKEKLNEALRAEVARLEKIEASARSLLTESAYFLDALHCGTIHENEIHSWFNRFHILGFGPPTAEETPCDQ